MVLRLHSMPFFPKQGAVGQVDFLDPWIAMCDRVAMDCTGLGLGLFDYFDAKYPSKVMGIQFAGSNEQHVKIKTAMAVSMKQRFEKGVNRIPRDMEIRQGLQSIKREVTGTGVKFDAPHIEVDTAVSGGKRKKVYQHADEFWAKAMCDLAAENSVLPACVGVDDKREDRPRHKSMFDMNPARPGAKEASMPPPQERSRRQSVWQL